MVTNQENIEADLNQVCECISFATILVVRTAKSKML